MLDSVNDLSQRPPIPPAPQPKDDSKLSSFDQVATIPPAPIPPQKITTTVFPEPSKKEESSDEIKQKRK
jgi:hypothetical protein